MSPPVEPEGTTCRVAPVARAPSLTALLVGTGLLGHAALVLAGALPAPQWVPILECLGASLVGLRQLRRVEEGQVEAPEPVASPVVFPAFPARVATPRPPADGADVPDARRGA